MSRKRKKKTAGRKLSSAHPVKDSRSGHGKTSMVEPEKGKWASRLPVFRFILVFAMLVGVFYAFVATNHYTEGVIPSYARFYAMLTGAILRVLGQDVTAVGQTISSPEFSVVIIRGCDAIEPAALFVAGVLAFPIRISSKVWGIMIGTLFLQVLNVLRIMSLFLIGVYHPEAFEKTHVYWWQIIFIMLAIVMWAYWVRWATQHQESKLDVPS